MIECRPVDTGVRRWRRKARRKDVLWGIDWDWRPLAQHSPTSVKPPPPPPPTPGHSPACKPTSTPRGHHLPQSLTHRAAPYFLIQ